MLSYLLILPFVAKISLNKFSLKFQNVSIVLAKDMANYGIPVAVGNLSAWILSLSDRYLLQMYRDAQEVGIYSISYGLSEKAMMFLVSLFMLSCGPIGMNIYENQGKEASKEFLTKITRYYLIICFPAFVGLTAIAKPFIDVVVAESYYYGYRIIPFISFSIFLFGLQWIFAFSFRFYKKTSTIMIYILFSGLLNIVLNVIIIPRYGYVGASISTAISYTSLLILMFIGSRKLIKWQFPIRTLWNVIIVSIVMGTSAYFMAKEMIWSTGINVIFTILCESLLYFFILALCGEFENLSKFYPMIKRHIGLKSSDK